MCSERGTAARRSVRGSADTIGCSHVEGRTRARNSKSMCSERGTAARRSVRGSADTIGTLRAQAVLMLRVVQGLGIQSRCAVSVEQRLGVL
ncbi:hypothetical protein J6590_072799 [Homalodisca vitripennis]|nr:hypothetical protein J6590_072799 [Homalodisca vitripennis]